MVFWAQILYYRSIERSTTARRMGCDEVCTICSEEELAMMKSVSVWKQELGTMIGFSEKEIDEKLQDILDFADIGDYVYQPVKTYSSGMFVRLAFAVAINIDPEILIVDEALSVGDVFFQAKCYRKFEEFKKKGKTILFVSHDLSAISKYCDRAILLNQGVKLGEGSPKDMIDAYKQVLVGQYETPKAGVDVPDLTADGDVRAALDKQKKKQ